MTACILALASGAASATHDERRDREVRMSEDGDTRCVTERRVSTSSFTIRTVCVSPPPDERAERQLRQRALPVDEDTGSRRLGFTLQDNLDRDLGFRFVR